MPLKNLFILALTWYCCFAHLGNLGRKPIYYFLPPKELSKPPQLAQVLTYILFRQRPQRFIQPLIDDIHHLLLAPTLVQQGTDMCLPFHSVVK